jgi:hypothetical protein
MRHYGQRQKARHNPSQPSGWLRINQLPLGQTLVRKLIDAGLLDSVVAGYPGGTRGIRLISIESWERYIESQRNHPPLHWKTKRKLEQQRQERELNGK